VARNGGTFSRATQHPVDEPGEQASATVIRMAKRMASSGASPSMVKAAGQLRGDHGGKAHHEPNGEVDAPVTITKVSAVASTRRVVL